MATTRIATPPRVPRSPKSANSPHEVQPLVQPNDPVVAQARAVADTIRQLGRGRIPRDLPNLPLFSEGAPSPTPPPAPKPKPRLRHSATDAPSPDLERHRRKCVVCNHPDRQEIEEQFIEWRGPGDIANDFQIEEARYIRRHARALGLYARRRENYLFTLENLLERSGEIELTAAAYIKAVRAYACMCDTVRWTEPPIRVIGVRDSSAASQDRVDNEEQASSSSSLLPQAAFDHPASAKQTPSPNRKIRTAIEKTDVVSSASLLPQAASAKSAPSALESDVVVRPSSLPQAAFDDPATAKPATSASALESEKNSMNGALAPSSRERLEGGGSSSTSPRASSRSCVFEEKSVSVPSSLLPQAASEDGALCGSGRNLSRPQRREPQRKTSLDHASASECLEGRGSSSTSPRASSRSCVLEEKSVSVPSSLLPQAALNQPAAAEQTPPSGPSGAARSQKSVATSASSLPKAAFDNPATAKPAPPSGQPHDRDNLHFQGTAEAARLAGIEAGAAAPKGSASASLHHSQKTIDAGASPRSSLVTSRSPLPSNRLSPRLETSVTDTKQREEVTPNRPQNPK